MQLFLCKYGVKSIMTVIIRKADTLENKRYCFIVRGIHMKKILLVFTIIGVLMCTIDASAEDFSDGLVEETEYSETITEDLNYKILGIENNDETPIISDEIEVFDDGSADSLAEDFQEDQMLDSEELPRAGSGNSQYISVNTAVSGNVTRGFEFQKNYYFFDVTNAGNIYISFENPLMNDSKEYWKLILYNNENVKLWEGSVYGNRESRNFMKIGIPAGTYCLVVMSSDWCQALSSEKYTFHVNYESSDYWEREVNDSFLTATLIDVNTTYFGATHAGYEYEKDFYRFELEDTGYISVKFNNSLQGSKDTFWNLKLYNSNYIEMASVQCRGNKTITKLPTMGLSKGTYYIKITSEYWYKADSQDTYNFNVVFKRNSYWEKETNNGFLTATSMKLNTLYYGTTCWGNYHEKDFFRFSITSKGLYEVGFISMKQGHSDVCWKFTLYDGSYNKLGTKYVVGSKTYHYICQNLEKGTYYIGIESYDSSWASSTDVYKIYTTKLSGKPKLTSITSKNRRVYLKWNPASGAEGYYIYRSSNPNSGFKLIGRTTTTSYRSSELEKGKKYYFIIVSYKKVNSVVVESLESSLKGIIVK